MSSSSVFFCCCSLKTERRGRPFLLGRRRRYYRPTGRVDQNKDQETVFLGVPGRTAKAVGKVRKKNFLFFPLFLLDIFLFFEGAKFLLKPNSPQKILFLLIK
jgi:hypothetical protein